MKRKILTPLIVVVALLGLIVACDQPTPSGDDKDKEESFEGLGFVDYLTDSYVIGDLDLTLACEEPKIRVRYEDLRQPTEGLRPQTLALPQAGKGCHVEITRITVDDAIYVQEEQYNFSWETGDIVVLSNVQNSAYTLHLRVERQIPTQISDHDEDNRFMFRIMKVGNGNTTAHSDAGATILSNNNGLLMTSFLLVANLQQPHYIWSPAFVPTKRLQMAFHCQGHARSVAGQLVCKDYTYHDLKMVVISGLVDVAEFKRRDLCFIESMKALPINSAIVDIPSTMLPSHLNLLNTIVLRSRYLDHTTGNTQHSCQIFPLAPHLSPYITSNVDTDYFYSL